MAEIEFIYNSEYTIIPCYRNEKLKDIIQRYKNKIRNNLSSVYYLYSGNIIYNIELTFDQIANQLDRERNKMTIQINPINITNEKNIIKPKLILCPKCKKNSRIKINDYKINIYGCENNHNTNNILFNEYFNLQNIDESQVLCYICKSKKCDSYNRIFYRCNICNINLCVRCKYNHEKNHNNNSIIEYDKKYYICE